MIKITDSIINDLNIRLADIIIQKSLTNNSLNFKTSHNNTIYHYATLPSFLSIIQTQTFFCTDLRYLNDKLEYQYGINQILATVSKLKAQNKFIDILSDFEDYINLFHKTERYATCFSQDGDLLSQWRAYANHGKGVSIGFDLSTFKSAIFQLIEGSQIIYDNEQQLHIIEFFIETIIDFFEAIKGNYNWSDSNYERIVNLTIVDFLEDQISNYKSEWFKEEKEYRFEHKNDRYSYDEELHFRTSDSMIIPYKILETKYNKLIIKNKDYTKPTVTVKNYL